MDVDSTFLRLSVMLTGIFTGMTRDKPHVTDEPRLHFP
jgi:hypothetical protein